MILLAGLTIMDRGSLKPQRPVDRAIFLAWIQVPETKKRKSGIYG